MSSRCLHAIYCDDVRQENTGKLCMIGVYTGDLVVRQMPATLPQLVLNLTASTPATEPFERIKVEVRRDDEVLLSLDSSDETTGLTQALENARREAEALENIEERVQVIRMALHLAPFEITKPGVLRVRMETEREGEVLRAPALRLAMREGDGAGTEPAAEGVAQRPPERDNSEEGDEKSG